jgi:phosphoribosylglycinamide formyltransferase 2
MDAKGTAFEGVDEALRVPQTDIRLFGKPEAYIRRRMGVALAFGDNIDDALEHARSAAGKVKPVRC